uniref:Uncharacterized protein n=1 Tax=Tetraselmis sp. GSL018 TaxID=582737 RepID=A0A061S9N1_9CHLO|mmetsp:Transcript_2750/g.6419  ORF Transcript_2750/g.6419 Transcript_2750/m.6419 type:complete len:284 (-) Transcript_2750:254-1105(-)
MALSDKLASIFKPVSNRGPALNNVLALLLAVALLSFFVAKEFASSQRNNLLAGSNYKFDQLKAALEEKDKALAESLEILEQTQKAQKLQEETLEDLRQKLEEYKETIRVSQEAARHREVAVRLKEQAEHTASSAVQSTQLCRQESAAALQQKDMQMQQLNHALESARKEMNTMQGDVQRAQERLRGKEGELKSTIEDYRRAIIRTKGMMHDSGASVAYLAEKTRQQHQQHQSALEYAKSERSCKPEVDKLTAEVRSLAKWKREAIHQGCRAEPARRRLLGDGG